MFKLQTGLCIQACIIRACWTVVVGWWCGLYLFLVSCLIYNRLDRWVSCLNCFTLVTLKPLYLYFLLDVSKGSGLKAMFWPVIVNIFYIVTWMEYVSLTIIPYLLIYIILVLFCMCPSQVSNLQFSCCQLFVSAIFFSQFVK